MRRLGVVALVVAVSLPLAQPASTQERRVSAALQEVLETRAAAINSGDRVAFEETIAPEPEDFKRGQLTWFDRMQKLPISDYVLRQELDLYGPLTRQKDVDEHGRGTVVTSVEEKFRIDDFDQSPDINTLYFTFARRGSRYLVAGDTPTDDLGLFSERQLWEFAEVNIRTTEHFLIMFHPKDASLANATIEQAEAALPAVGRLWDREWSETVIIFVPSNSAELEDLLGATFDVSNFVAFAQSGFDLEEFSFVGTRIIVNPPNFSRMSSGLKRSILVHELLHVATRDASGIRTPSWVEEGLAQLAQGSPVAPAHRRVARVFDGDVADDMEFLTGTSTDISIAYATALSAMGYMRDEFGLDRVTDFYEELGGVGIAPGTVDYHVDQASKKTLGKSFDEFETAWAKRVRG
jgi:hypothetical protein